MIQRFGIFIMLCACGEHRGGIGVSDDASSSSRIDARTTDAGGTISDASSGDGWPSPPLDAPDYDYEGVSCGATTCGPVATCCVDNHGNATCAAPGTCPSGSRSLCSGPEDCQLLNDVCCGSNEGTTTTKECRPANQCTSSGLSYACYTDADCVAQDINFTKCCDTPLSIHKQCRPSCH